jgi:hypothetical protein
MAKIRYVRIFSKKEYANIKNTEPELLKKIVKVTKIGGWPKKHPVFTMQHESGEPAENLLSLTIEEDEEEDRERRKLKRERLNKRRGSFQPVLESEKNEDEDEDGDQESGRRRVGSFVDGLLSGLRKKSDKVE